MSSRHPSIDRPDGLTPEQRAILNVPFRIAPGYGMRVLQQAERQKVYDGIGEDPGPRNILQVWEPPRSKSHLYIVTADVSSGVELDNSVIDVTRVGTIREPEEQVAQFVTNTVDETDLAYIIDSIGRLYKGRDDQFAHVGIECNGLGISTQNELIRHIGYTNLYIWQYLDAVDGSQFTKRYGWYTNQRTRPLLLQTYVHAIKTVDKHTNQPDYRINSPWTMQELADFISPGPLWMAEHADGANDDCIFAGAIGVFIARTMYETGHETVHDTRRRLSEEMARVEAKQKLTDRGISFQTTDSSYDEMMGRDAWDIEPDTTEHYR